jgi:serine/threonine-protein kinase
MQAYIAGIYAVGYLVARASRRSTKDAVTRLEVAVRELAQREALFQEAREDLARALRIGGRGRYTDQTVGCYRLGVVIGRGGMGEVYAAIHVGTGEPAAIKLLYRDAVDDSNDYARFVREAKVAAAIESENVVRLLDAAVEGAERPYLAMECLRGEDLGAILRRERRLSIDDTVEMASQVAAGLAAAHAVGVVHRDLKPSNLFRAERDRGDPVWKILDFGVSTLAGRGGTLTGQNVVGTPAYMAPEQARGGKVDIRTDVYALGALAYRVLTGRPPVSGKDVPAILYEVVHGVATPASQLVEVSDDVDAVLSIAMAKESGQRFETADELARALASARDGDLPDELRLRAAALEADRLVAAAG